MSLTITSACFMGPIDPPPPIETSNRYPHIVVDSVQPQSPAPSGIILVDFCQVRTSGEVLVDEEFRIDTVVEYDVEQDLHIRWFVNYDPARADIHRFPFYEQVIYGESGGPIVRNPTPVRIAPAWLIDTTVGIHNVEVVVADSDWALSGGVVNRTPQEPGLSDEFQWSIDLVPHGDCP